MRVVFVSALCAMVLGANESRSILNDVTNLRQKYEECVQSQKISSPSDATAKIKGYQTRITTLENQIKQSNNELQLLKKQNTESKRELSQKKGVIQSLERSLTLKDQQFRDSSALNERLAKEANAVKVGKIERESLKSALVKAKMDAERIEKSMGKSDQEVVTLRVSLVNAKADIEKLRSHPLSAQTVQKSSIPMPSPQNDQSAKIKALQDELSKANAALVQMQKNPHHTVIQEKVVEKVVYKDRPIVQEKIVEKVVYKERPVVVEKVVVKPVSPTEHLNKALSQKLAQSPKLTVPKVTKLIAPSTVVAEKVKKVSPVVTESKATALVPATASVTKKGSPSAYRMAINAPVYNAPKGSQIDTWEEHRSFTSGTASNGWIKITGYFVNRVWTRADEELWVKESDVIRR